MKVAILTYGTLGDLVPYLALSRAFMEAGHEVRLGGPRIAEFARSAAGLGIPYVPIGPEEPFQGEVITRLTEMGSKMRDQLPQIRLIIDRYTAPFLAQMYKESLPLGTWGDVLISHFFQPAGRLVGDRLGCAFVSGTLMPACVPSAHVPPPGMPNGGTWLNRLSWRFVTGRLNRVWLAPLNQLRQRLRLPLLKDLVREGLYSRDLNLVFVSRHVMPHPPDWAPEHQLTGYWFLDRPDWTPPPDLVEFLAKGPKPIAIGFSTAPAVGDMTRLFAEAVERTGTRAVLLSGWAGLGNQALPPSIFQTGSVPHDWLLPRVSAIVYHAGSGTTAASLWAGIPSVPIPHMLDALYWADMVHKLGVAPKPIHRRDLTVDRLAAAIRTATTDTRMQARAAQLGTLIRQEDGVGTAVGLVEEYVARRAAGRTGANGWEAHGAEAG
jgi:sterol 3beta-glucosyltransferase